MNEDLFGRLEVQLGRLLFAGVMSSAVCLAIPAGFALRGSGNGSNHNIGV